MKIFNFKFLIFNQFEFAKFKMIKTRRFFKFKISNSDKGFTLIELIVVMAVFLFIIGGALTIFMSIVEHQRRALAEQKLFNQTSYVMEYMSKAMRMAKADTSESCFGAGNEGYIYMLTRPDTFCNSDTDPQCGFYRGIKFINASNDDACEEFYLDNSDLQHPVLKEIKNNGEPVAVTSQGLVIDSIKFGINGNNGSNGSLGYVATGDDEQPRVTISMQIKIPGDTDQQVKKIQTTVSQRNLNN
jgi:prepilin-type N-terminal cleavage/methylation domain-containing protein